MNIYKLIIDVSNYYKKDNNLIKKYNKISNEVYELRNDAKYYSFFGLIDSYKSYYFFAPNISLQIIKNLLKQNKHDVISKEECELIIQNKSIKEYVEISNEINNMTIEITKRILVSFDDSSNSEENYSYNKCADELGFIGFGKLLHKFSNSGKLLSEYDCERSKIIHESAFVFPIEILKNGLYQKYENKSEYIEIVKSYENFNIMLTIINILLFTNLCNKLIDISNDVEILSTSQKNNVKRITIKSKKIELLNGYPYVVIIKDKIYFVLSKTINFGNGNFDITCNCFTINFDKKDSLLNFSIDNLSVLI